MEKYLQNFMDNVSHLYDLGYGKATEVYQAYPASPLWMLLGGAVAVVAWRSDWWQTKVKTYMGNRRMRAEHEAEVKEYLGDAIYDAMLRAEIDGHMTPEDTKIWCRRFGNFFDLRDFLPRGEKTLKEKIKDRLVSLRSKKPLPIPGDGPVKEIVPNSEKRKKNGFLYRLMNERKKAA